MSRHDLPAGYLETRPTPEKLTVTNLVDFTSPRGAYGEVDSTLKRIGTTALILLFHIFVCFGVAIYLRNWLLGILLVLVFIPVPARLVSLIVFNERRVMKDYKKRGGRLRTIKDEELISFYDISDNYPYITSFIDGSIGVTLKVVRKTEVGKATERAYNHAEVLSHFYNQAHTLGIEVSHIDIQAVNTKDRRFDQLRQKLNNVKTETLERIMASIYNHLEDMSVNTEITQEYFLLTATQTEEMFKSNVDTLSRILSPNAYKRVEFLNSQGVSELIKSLYGLERFEIKKAMQAVSSGIGGSSLRLLWVGDGTGRRKTINESLSRQQLEQRKVVEKSFEQTPTQEEPKKPVNNQRIDIFSSENEVVEIEERGMTTVLTQVEPTVVKPQPKPQTVSNNWSSTQEGQKPSGEPISVSVRKDIKAVEPVIKRDRKEASVNTLFAKKTKTSEVDKSKELDLF